VRVVLVAEGMPLPEECDKLVYAVVQQPFSAVVLSDLVKRNGSDRQIVTQNQTRPGQPEIGEGG
jgi:hypothetical protein